MKILDKIIRILKRKPKQIHHKGSWRYKKDGITKEYLD